MEMSVVGLIVVVGDNLAILRYCNYKREDYI